MEEDNDTVMLLKGHNDREMVVLYYFAKFHSIGAASLILVLCIILINYTLYYIILLVK